MDAQTKKDIQIYQAYLYVIHHPKQKHGGMRRICHEFAISRAKLYQVIERVKFGNPARIKKAMEDSRLEVLWKYKYEPRFLAISKNRKAFTVEVLKELIAEMDTDGFPTVRIAELLKKDRSTIIHHLSK